MPKYFYEISAHHCREIFADDDKQALKHAKETALEGHEKSLFKILDSSTVRCVGNFIGEKPAFVMWEGDHNE